MTNIYGGIDALNILKEGYNLKDTLISNSTFLRKDFEGVATEISFEDCVFDRCTFGINSRYFGVQFARCEFSNTKFESFFGGASSIRKTSFLNCSIETNKLKNCTFGAEFKFCKISGQFKGCHFEAEIDHCDFFGDFHDVKFGARHDREASKLSRSDFSNVQIFDVQFENCYVLDCKFPQSNQFYVVNSYKSVLQELLKISQANDREYGIDSYTSRLRNAAPSQDIGVINLEHLEIFAGPKGFQLALDTVNRHRVNAPPAAPISQT